MHHWEELHEVTTHLYSFENGMCTVHSGHCKNSTTAGMESNSCLPAHSNMAQEFRIINEEGSLPETLQGEFKARGSN